MTRKRRNEDDDSDMDVPLAILAKAAVVYEADSDEDPDYDPVSDSDDSTCGPTKSRTSRKRKYTEQTCCPKKKRHHRDELHDHMKRLTKLLQANNLEEDYVYPDGNCFFNATIKHMVHEGHDLTDSMSVRQELCEHILQNENTYAPFLGSCEFANDVNQIKQNGIWNASVGDIMPLATANYFFKTISIFSSGTPMHILVHPTMGLPTGVWKYAYLAIEGGEHYSATKRSADQSVPHTHIHTPIEGMSSAGQCSIQAIQENGAQFVPNVHQADVASTHKRETTDQAVPSPISKIVRDLVDRLGCATSHTNAVLVDKDIDSPVMIEVENSAANKLMEIPSIISNTESDDVVSSYIDLETSQNEVDFSDLDVLGDVDVDDLLLSIDIDKLCEPRCSNDDSLDVDTFSSNNCNPIEETASENASWISVPKRKKKQPDQWKKNLRKRLRNTGQSYVSAKKGKVVEAKDMGSPSVCECKRKLCSELTEDERLRIRETFWELGDHNRQSDFIKHHIQEKKTVGMTKQFTRTYFLPKHNENIEVCKVFFMSVLKISDKRIRNVCDKIRKDPVAVLSDNRGKHMPANKTPESKVQEVLTHIRSFPVMRSHYYRKDSEKQYLDSRLNLSKLYSLYAEKTDNPLSKTKYAEIFNSQNYSFHVPKKDRCDICSAFENMQTPTSEELSRHEAHMKKKELARDEYKGDTEFAKEQQHVSCAAFDLEKVLPVPSTNASSLYYSRKLSAYNLTVYDMTTSEGNNYMWSEVDGGRGSCEIATCMYKHVLSRSFNITHFIFYSDGCGGQNRSTFIAIMFHYLINTNSVIEVIDHKFLCRGHTYNGCDSVHAAIEFNSRHAQVFVPHEYYNIVTTARRKKPYTVLPLSYHDFIDFKKMLKAYKYNLKLDSNGQKVQWLDIVWLRYEKEKADEILFKNSFEDAEFRVIPLLQRRRGRRSSEQQAVIHIPVTELQRYSKQLPITKAKKDDLIKLCKSGIIPAIHHAFYQGLTTNETLFDSLPEPDVNEEDCDTD